jgi:hypothetical protein
VIIMLRVVAGLDTRRAWRIIGKCRALYGWPPIAAYAGSPAWLTGWE